MATLLVTGGTGFVGSWIIRALERSPVAGRFDTLRLLVRNPRKAQEIRPKRLRLELVEGDLLDPPTVRRAAEGADAVIHTAALYDTKGGWSDFYVANVEATRALVDGLPDGAALVLTSTYGVYGFPKTHEPLREDFQPRKPIWHYQRTKLLQEQLAAERCAARGIRFAAIRPPVVIGPGDRLLLPVLVERIRSGKMMIIGDGQNSMPYAHPADVAEAHLLALEKIEESDGSAFHLASFYASMNEFLGVLCAEIGAPPVTRHVPVWLARTAGFLGDLVQMTGVTAPFTSFSVAFLTSHARLDQSRIRDTLGFWPAYDLRQTLAESAAWYRSERPTPR